MEGDARHLKKKKNMHVSLVIEGIGAAKSMPSFFFSLFLSLFVSFFLP
jgi:hypothetical protein